MEAVLMAPSPTSASAAANSSSRSFAPPLPWSGGACRSHGLCSGLHLKPKKVHNGSRSVVVAGPKKRRNGKSDGHSFAPKPEEATGPFPEAVLLKKKTVEKNGKVLPEFADAEEENLFEFLSLQLESDLNVERMRHYEVVYLIHEDNMDDVESIITKVQDFVREKKGRIWRLNNWGLRKLAYKIKKASKANYVLMNFELEAKLINDFKALLDKDERIIRHLVIKRKEAVTENCPPPPEFHTLQAGEMGEEDGEGEFDAEDDLDDELELEMADYDDDADDIGDNIVYVDADDDDNAPSKVTTTLMARKGAT